MQLSVKIQLYAVIGSMLTGFALGAVYDLCHVLRKRLGAAILFDLLFWLAALFALFTAGMDIGGGSLHILMLLSALIGFALYMALLSAPVFALIDKAAALIGLLLSPAKKVVKKFGAFAKNRLSAALMRIKMKIISGRRANHADETADTADNRGTRCIRYPEPVRGTAGTEGLAGAHTGADANAPDGKVRKRGTAKKRRAKKRSGSS